VPLDEEIPLERGRQRGVFLINRYFTAINYSLASERLRIDTDLLRIITSTADELSGDTSSMTLNDPEPQNRGGVMNFSRFQAATRIPRVNCSEITLNRCCRASHEQPIFLLIVVLFIIICFVLCVSSVVTVQTQQRQTK